MNAASVQTRSSLLVRARPCSAGGARDRAPPRRCTTTTCGLSPGRVGHNPSSGWWTTNKASDQGLPARRPADRESGRLHLRAPRTAGRAGPTGRGLEVVWPYEQRCPIHGTPRPRRTPAGPPRSAPVTSVGAPQTHRQREGAVDDPRGSRRGARRPARRPVRSGRRARRAAERRSAATAAANDRLWWGLAPRRPRRRLRRAPRRGRRRVRRAPLRSARRTRPARSDPAGPLATSTAPSSTTRPSPRSAGSSLPTPASSIREFVDALVAAGWTEEQARNTDVRRTRERQTSNPQAGTEDGNNT